MRRHVVIALLLSLGCGDLKFDDAPTAPGAPPPGSTSSLGSMSATVDNFQLNAPLQTPAIWRNESFGFTAINAQGVVTKIVAISVRLSGPGTYTVGGINSPAVSYLEMDGTNTYRWFTSSQQGAGSVTVAFLSPDAASGFFNAEVVPDSATRAAGYGNRSITGGTFSVAVMKQ